MTTADAPDDDEDWTDDGEDEVEADDGSDEDSALDDDEDWTDEQWVSWAMKKAHAPSVPANACRVLASAYARVGEVRWPSDEERDRLLFPVLHLLNNSRTDQAGEERRREAIWDLVANVWVPRAVFAAVCDGGKVPEPAYQDEDAVSVIEDVCQAIGAVVIDWNCPPNDVYVSVETLVHLANLVVIATYARAALPEDADDSLWDALDVEADTNRSFVLRLCVEELNDVVINDLLFTPADTASTAE